MKRTIPSIFLLLAVLLPLVLSSCAFPGRGEKPETEALPPVETEPPLPLFSWEEPLTGDDASDSSSQTGGLAELRDFGSLPPASTLWTSLTGGEDAPRDGLFTRAATALVTEQIVRYCMSADWLSGDFTVPDQKAVTAFLVSTYRYRNVSGYPTYLASLLEWDADAGVYTVAPEAADAVARGLFRYTDHPTETKTGFGYDLLAGRYEFGAGTIERTPYELSDLKISSDAVSTEARFRITEIAGGRRTDRGEYRIFYYQPNDGSASSVLPRMLLVKKGAALTASQTKTEPPILAGAASAEVPAFLSPDVQTLFREAKMLYPALVGAPAEAIDLLPMNDGEPYLPGTLYGLTAWTGADGAVRTYFYPRGRYTNFYAFNTVLTSIFTWSFAQELAGTRYVSIDGRLAADANGGRQPRTDYLPALDDFELVEAADWKIDFWYYTYYGDPENPSAERTLITLLNTDIGWRFASFATGEYVAGESVERSAPERAPQEPAGTAAEEPAQTPAEEPAQTPAEEPVQTPAEEPVQTPAEEPAQTPAEEPAADPDDWWDPPAEIEQPPFDVSGSP